MATVCLKAAHMTTAESNFLSQRNALAPKRKQIQGGGGGGGEVNGEERGGEAPAASSHRQQEEDSNPPN